MKFYPQFHKAKITAGVKGGKVTQDLWRHASYLEFLLSAQERQSQRQK